MALDRLAIDTETKIKKMFKLGRGEYLPKNIKVFLNEVDTVLKPDGEWNSNMKAEFTSTELAGFDVGIQKGRDFVAWVESVETRVEKMDIFKTLSK